MSINGTVREEAGALIAQLKFAFSKLYFLFEKKWYPESMYLLAMLDYLSRVNEIPLCTKYNDIRERKLSRPIYPTGVLLTSKVMNSNAAIKEAEIESIPEFARFNIFESEVRNVV